MRLRTVLALIAVALSGGAVGPPALAAELDPAFGDGGVTSFDVSDPEERILDVAFYDNGSAVALLEGLRVAGTTQGSLVKYRADGEVDPSFGTRGTVVLSGNATSWTHVDLDGDGAIVVTGTYRLVRFDPPNASEMAPRLRGYQPDGSLDEDFGSGGTSHIPAGPGNELLPGDALVSDGKIFVTGSAPATADGGTDVFLACRDVKTAALCPEFNGESIATMSFGPSGEKGDSIATDDSGGLLVGASVRSTSEENAGLVRFERDGDVDESFSEDGSLVVSGFGRGRVEVATDGASRPILAGTSLNSLGVSRFSQTGDVDDFGLQVVSRCGSDAASVVELAVSADRLLVACSQRSPTEDTVDSQLVAFHAGGANTGTLDYGFGVQGGLEPTGSDGRPIEAEWLGQAPGARTILAGAVRAGPLVGDTDAALVEIGASGQVVPGLTEATHPLRTSNDTSDFALTRDGYVVLANPQVGSFDHAVLVAYREDATLDYGFGVRGVAGRDGRFGRMTEILADSRGRLFGRIRNANGTADLVRVSRRGALSSSFASDGTRRIDGGVGSVGPLTTAGYAGDGVLAFVNGRLRRVDAAGRVLGFGAYTPVGCDSPQGIAEDSRGRILELCEDLDSSSAVTLRRLEQDGSPDERFGTRTVASPDGDDYALISQLLVDAKDRPVLLHLTGEIQRFSKSGGRSTLNENGQIEDAGYFCTSDGLTPRANGGLIAAVCGSRGGGISVFSIRPDLTVEPGFGVEGRLLIPDTDQPRGIVMDPLGRIVLGADVLSPIGPLGGQAGVIRIIP